MAVRKEKGAESGDVEKMEQDNFPSHILKDRELRAWVRHSSKEAEGTKGKCPPSMVTVGQ